MYNFGKWEPLEYTYANFRDPNYLKELEIIRNNYLKKRKKSLILEQQGLWSRYSKMDGE